MPAADRLVRTLRIPTLPSIVTRICSLVEDPEVGIREVGEAVAEDPAMTATVLRVANSATYGLNRQVATTAEAATVLGARALRDMTLQAAVIREYEHLQSIAGFDVRLLWKHGALVAHLAKHIARELRSPASPEPDEVYTCGLLHDLGRLVLLDGLREPYLKVLEESRKLEQPSHLLERERLKTTHMRVGSKVLERWSLPAVIAEVAMKHHGTTPSEAGCSELGIVMLADTLARDIEAGTREAPASEVLSEHQAALGLSADKMAEVYEWALEVWPTLAF